MTCQGQWNRLSPMSPQPITSDTDLWPSKAQAAERLAVVEKTIDRMIKRNQLRTKVQRRPGRQPSIGVCPEDLDRLAPKPVQVLPNQPTKVPGQSGLHPVPTPILPGGQLSPDMIERLWMEHPELRTDSPPESKDLVPVLTKTPPPQSRQRPPAQPVPVHLKHRVTTAEAVELGFSEKLLTQLVKEGRIERICGHYRVRDLEAL